MMSPLSPPLAIAYVQSVAERGGVEVCLLNILRHLDRTQFTPTVFILAPGPLVEEIQATGTEVQILPAGRTRDLRSTSAIIHKLAEQLTERSVCLVHSHNAHAHVIGGLSARRTGARSVFHLHGVPPRSLNHHGALAFASVAVPADCTVAVSQWVAQTFERTWFRRGHTRLVYNGVDISTLPYSPGSRSVREEFGFCADAPMVLLPARLERWKGVHVFVDAMAQIASLYPKAGFIVAGGSLFGLEPDYEQLLRKQIGKAGLEHQVLLTGHRSDVYRLMQASDIVVHCSLQPEPFGLGIVEAMAHSKPVIATALGGALEIVRHGETGFLVPPGDPGALAGAVCDLLRDPDRRHRIGSAGRSRMKELFTAERMVAQLEQLYHELIGTKPYDRHLVRAAV